MAEGDRSLSAGELSDIIGNVARTLAADLGPLSPSTPAEDAALSGSDPAGSANDDDFGGALALLSEIGNVDGSDSPLAELWQELDEIRTVTQDAAAKFLACAKKVEAIAERPDLPSEEQEQFERLATDMFEASSFQDLTGQRLTHIGDILRRIEFLVASARGELGDESVAEAVETLSDQVEKTEQRKMEYILRGPQEAGTANIQEEIDKILASFD
jgi:chemotaxis protein CheZ